MAAHCRSAVQRDHYNKEILGPKETELESRIGIAMGQLYIGMEAIGVREPARWGVLQKIALDSMPQLRRKILECVVGGPKEGVLMTDIMRFMTVREAEAASRAPIDRAIVDLAVQGVLTKVNMMAAGASLNGSHGGERETGLAAAGGGKAASEGNKVRIKMTEWMSREYNSGFK